jgi:hypothetical protein
VKRTQGAAAVPVKGSVRAKSDVSIQGAEPAKAWKETRRCRLCHKVGHLKFQCPDNPIATVQVVISTDIQDSTSDSYDDFGTLVATFHDVDVHQVLLFGVTDVLFDNQGGKSIFRDESLLHNVCAITKPYSLAGIDGSTATGLKVNRCGAFRDFGKLGNSIDYLPLSHLPLSHLPLSHLPLSHRNFTLLVTFTFTFTFDSTFI